MKTILILCTAILLSGCGGSESQDISTPILTPPAAATRTWTFHGQIENGGTVDGTFTYEKDANPSAEHVRGLAPNVVYPLTAWDLTARLSVSTGATFVEHFSQTGFLDTSELCFNQCDTGLRSTSRVHFDNGTTQLTITFVLPVIQTTPPVEVNDWGVFDSPASKLVHFPDGGTFLYVRTVTNGVLSGG